MCLKTIRVLLVVFVVCPLFFAGCRKTADKGSAATVAGSTEPVKDSGHASAPPPQEESAYQDSFSYGDASLLDDTADQLETVELTDAERDSLLKDSIRVLFSEYPSAELISRYAAHLYSMENREKDTTFAESLIIAYNALCREGRPRPFRKFVSPYQQENPGFDTSLVKMLPQVHASAVFPEDQWWFIAGGDFFSEYFSDTLKEFHDAGGEPELRYRCDYFGVENFLRYTLQYSPVHIDVQAGPPIEGYEVGMQSVNGTGSLIHCYIDRPAAWFITPKGVIDGSLVSIDYELFETGRCPEGSTVIFAGRTALASPVLGIVLTRASFDPSAAKVTKKGSVWTVDINGDNIPDIGGVVRNVPAQGPADILGESSVFYNDNGRWMLGSYMIMPDCS